MTPSTHYVKFAPELYEKWRGLKKNRNPDKAAKYFLEKAHKAIRKFLRSNHAGCQIIYDPRKPSGSYAITGAKVERGWLYIDFTVSRAPYRLKWGI